jgi:hypothetical protein
MNGHEVGLPMQGVRDSASLKECVDGIEEPGLVEIELAIEKQGIATRKNPDGASDDAEDVPFMTRPVGYGPSLMNVGSNCHQFP